MDSMQRYQLTIVADVEGNACFVDSDNEECIIVIPKNGIMKVVSKLLSIVSNLN